MPTGTSEQKHPADVIGNSVRIACIATGKEPEVLPADDGMGNASQASGKKSGGGLR